MKRFSQILIIAALLGWGATSQASEPLPDPTGSVLLTVSGNVEQTNAPGQARFDKAMLEALGSASFTTRSALSDKPQLFEGISLRAILQRIGAKGETLKASALNDYEIKIPLTDLQYEPLLAMRIDGQELKVRDKGPLWIVYPRDAHKALQEPLIDSRWVWQLNRLHVE
jgi:hypothetical protein